LTGEKQPFCVTGPGEYEIKGVFIKGFPNGSSGKLLNTIYSIRFDNINLCHLGALSSAEIPKETRAELGPIDILFVPTYNEESLTAAQAHKISNLLNPKIIVPLFVGSSGTDTLKKFLKESGAESMKPTDKLTLKKKDIEDHNGDIIPIKSF